MSPVVGKVCKLSVFMFVFTLSSGLITDLDVGFIIDGPGSVKDKDPNNWNLLIDFLGNVVKMLPKQGTQAVTPTPQEDSIFPKDFYSLHDVTSRLINTVYPTTIEKTTRKPPKTTPDGDIVPLDDMESPTINLLVIIVAVVCCIIIIITIIIVILCIRKDLHGKCNRNNSNTSFDEDEEITQSGTVTHVDAPGVYYTTDDGGENINPMYEGILEIDNNSEVGNCEGDEGQYEEVQNTTHTYQQLLTKQKPLTIQSWIKKNNLPNTVGEVLKQQNITTIPVLRLLTVKDIEDLGLSIGDRSQLRAAIKTLIEG